MQLPRSGWTGLRAWTPTSPINAPVPSGGSPALTQPLGGVPFRAAFTATAGNPSLFGRGTVWSSELWAKILALMPTGAPTMSAVADSVDGAAFAQRVVELTNRERSMRGLPPLAGRYGLQYVAQQRAADMIRRGYFDHTDPDGRDPFWHLRANGVKYRTAGENIASGQRSPEAVVAAWMRSPGHRANILNPNFGHMGVGAVLNTATGQLYWAELFSD